MEKRSFHFYKVVNLQFVFKKDVRIFNLFDKELFSKLMCKELDIDNIPAEIDIKSKYELRGFIEKLPNREEYYFDYKSDLKRYNDYSDITQNELNSLLELEKRFSMQNHHSSYDNLEMKKACVIPEEYSHLAFWDFIKIEDLDILTDFFYIHWKELDKIESYKSLREKLTEIENKEDYQLFIKHLEKRKNAVALIEYN